MTEPALAKYIRWLVYITALVPLVIFSQYISPFHFGKVIVLRSIVQIMLGLYILLAWRDASYRPKGHPILWAFLAFTLAFTLTTITSVARLQSFWGTLERMGGLFTFWHYFVFYVIATSVLRTRRDWKMLLDLMVAVGVASALYGFLQKTNWTFILGSGGRARPFGTIGNPALFAGYQILVAFLALTLGFMKRSLGAWRFWYLAASGITLLAAISTAVRGSLVGIAVGGLVWALLWSVLNRSRRAKIALLTGLSGLVVFVFLGITLRSTSFVQNSPYLNRITNFSSKTFTVKTRFWAWSAGFDGWSESSKTVLVGWGPENFNVPFSRHFNPKFFTAPGAETFFDRAHNMFIEVLVTMGLVGFVAYLALFVVSFRTYTGFMKEPGDTRVFGIGLTAMTVAYMIHNAFIFDTSANFLTFFMLLAFATYMSLYGFDTVAPKPASGQRSMRWTGGQIVATCVLGLAVFIVVYTINIRPTKANYASTRAIVAGWQGDWVRAVNKYREAIDADTPGRYEFRHRFAQYILELSGSTDVTKIPNFTDVALEVIEDVKKNTIENPQDYLPYLYLSRLYIILGKGNANSPYNDKALEMSAAALKISPTFVRAYYEVAQAYLNKHQPAVAVEWFKKAQALNPDVAVTYWYIGTVSYQIAAEKKDAAGIREALSNINKAVERGYELSESDGMRLVNVFLDLGDYEAVVRILEQLVAGAPTKQEYWAQLIAAYGQLGDRNKVIETIRRALAVPQISADATFKSRAEATLRSLGATP